MIQNVIYVVLLHSYFEFLAGLVEVLTCLRQHRLHVAAVEIDLAHYVEHLELRLELLLHF